LGAEERVKPRKHGISFDLAALVFDDPLQVTLLDQYENEERWRTLGVVDGVLMLLLFIRQGRRLTRMGNTKMKKSESYRQERQPGLRGKPTKTLTEKQRREIAALRQLSDESIDTSDIPEIKDWSGAVVGKFYRPLKEAVSIRLDVDVLAWLKAKGPGYQTRLNRTLRELMMKDRRGGPGGRRSQDSAFPHSFSS
jgi:uncharacterized protein (DUF4415 family)